ncbi:hypothetical protein CLAFUW4_10738 [Fulvia fulva]|uniref:Uncharacterized protein n=1 Tax=Passalora fulva TaxID=5499 RepID=A0A9Q8LF31_PASFU|nr:uncharacterized protein CLAFUR5_05351 [Fulvia fulva]KAK4615949.1 hypothetical protein CLAFUR4_10743 [Fulvia fulva]KAK4616524.1 hypothetical protein CLAFUR0_10750 [Fulvia fulva]UJO16044.1 hypothetical protein CLAFUR5_05351 [Fulvia fulva]WPV19188.1 hypothetical protein CLAFUW4_10738 [Fulvia fulva]WPV33705.1 hypothetical protein CLAFUW7_10740 [Fulvia fulva]
MWETAQDQEGPDPNIGTRASTFGQERLQAYDEHNASRDWQDDFRSTKLKVEDSTIVDCWVCKAEGCEWCKGWQGRTNQEVVSMMLEVKKKHGIENGEHDQDMEDA